MRTVVAMIGQPAVGKSTIVREFMKAYRWVYTEPRKLVNGMYNVNHDLYVLGKYSEDEKFPGTDRFSMAVQPEAETFMKNENANVLFEGDRLGTASFLELCANLISVDFHLLVIEADKQALYDRHRERADTQSETFLKGRETKISNITSSLELLPYISVMKNNTKEDLQKVVYQLKSWFQLK